MESEFYNLLKNVGYSYRFMQLDTIPLKLEDALKKAADFINDNAVSNLETLKIWVKCNYINISQEQRRIEKHYKEKGAKMINIKMHTDEYEKKSIELNQLHKILCLTDELRGRFLEYFAAYHPKELFKNKELINQLKELTPFSNLTRHFLWSVKEHEEKGDGVGHNLDRQLNECLPPQQTEKPKPELTINQIALIYAYSEIQITRKNGNEIAKEYGHNSGEKLFQRFTFYSSPANRKGRPQPCTPKKLKNKIELLESVLEHLPKDKQNRIKDEVSILKTIQETEYL